VVTSIPGEKFEVLSEETIVIDQPLEVIKNKLWEMEKWPELLPHVLEIEVLYNDKIYQEFFMTISSDTGKIKVRSIRSLKEGSQMDFFQPEPPEILKYHAGTWTLEKVNENCTKISLLHKCTPNYEKAGIKFLTDNQKEIRNRIKLWISEHGKTTLSSWRDILTPGKVGIK
jgi:hypothetical protein